MHNHAMRVRKSRVREKEGSREGAQESDCLNNIVVDIFRRGFSLVRWLMLEKRPAARNARVLSIRLFVHAFVHIVFLFNLLH